MAIRPSYYSSLRGVDCLSRLAPVPGLEFTSDPDWRADETGKDLAERLRTADSLRDLWRIVDCIDREEMVI